MNYPKTIALLSVLLTISFQKVSLPYVPVTKMDISTFPQEVMHAEHDANEVRLTLMSNGLIAFNEFQDPSAIAFWPKNTDNNYMYASGVLIGGIADINGDSIEEVFGAQVYDPWYANSEYAPGRFSDDPEDPLSRLYVSTDPVDLSEWPQEFSDDKGEPVVYSHQDIVGIYNDINGTPNFEYGPIGIQVEQRSMAFLAGRNSQVIIFIWDFTNVSGQLPDGPYTIRDAYIGIDNDMDIGNDFQDDRSSFVKYLKPEQGDSIPIMMAFAWDGNFQEWNFTGTPGFVGTKFLLTPGDDTDGVDNDGDGLIDESPYNGIDDDSDGEIDEWDEVDELGLVNHSIHCNPLSCNYRLHPATEEQLYGILSCDPPLECMLNTEETDVFFVISSGPFDWPPGRTVRMAAAYVFALPVGDPHYIEIHGDPPLPDFNDPIFTDLFAVALNTQSFFDAGFPDTLGYFNIYGTTQYGLSNIFDGPYDISTYIVSSEGVADAILYYSYDDGQNFSTAIMDHVEGDTFAGQIPSPEQWWTDIQYFIQAVDSSYQVVRDPGAAPDSSFEFTLVPAPQHFPPDSVTGLDPAGSQILAWIDYDNDGDLDVYQRNDYGTGLFRNDGERTFVDVTDKSGTGISGSSYRAASADYDNDGCEDLVVGKYYQHPLALFRNLGDGTFKDVTPQSGLIDTVNASQIAWCDIDRDGYADLLVTFSDYDIHLYMNQGDQTFVEETKERGLTTASQYTSEIVFFDADRDGDDDLLFVAGPSLYYENEGGVFEDKTNEAGLGLEASSATAFDIDSDLDFDLILRGDDPLILENDGAGHFTDTSEEHGLEVAGSSPFAVGDMNADALPDLLTGGSHYFYSLLNPDGKFIDVSELIERQGWSPCLSVADADDNGSLDLFHDGLFINNGIPGGIENKWLEVNLEGTVSNRSAIGAVAVLYSDDRQNAEFVSGCAPICKRLYFGLDQVNPDSLVIRWPSGIVQVERSLSSNTIVTIEEDSTLTGIGEEEKTGNIPIAFALHQNYPNPFNPQTTIRFDVPESAGKVKVDLSIYDVRGRLVRTLVEKELEPGQHRVVWGGRDERGEPVSSGVYLYSLTAGDHATTRKMIVMK